MSWVVHVPEYSGEYSAELQCMKVNDSGVEEHDSLACAWWLPLAAQGSHPNTHCSCIHWGGWRVLNFWNGLRTVTAVPCVMEVVV